MSDKFRETMTLHEARALLRELVDDGAECPCCRQFAKVYKRKLNAGMSASLIALYRAAGRTVGTFVHGPSVTTNHEYAQLSWWGLIEEEKVRRPDGGRSGWWCVTPKGEAFLHGEILYGSSHARVYDGRVLGFTGKNITIRDTLGDRFNYDELMGA